VFFESFLAIILTEPSRAPEENIFSICSGSVSY